MNVLYSCDIILSSLASYPFCRLSQSCCAELRSCSLDCCNILRSGSVMQQEQRADR